MKKLGVFFPILLMFVLAFSIIPNVSAQTELFYDDGSAEGIDSRNAGEYAAVKFSLPSGCSQAKLLKAKIYKVQDPNTEVKIHILGSDGLTELTTPFNFDIAIDNAWNDVDLTGKNIVVSGDFYVAIEYLISNDPDIGCDSSSSGKSYFGTPGSWTFITEPKHFNYMFRAVIEECNPVGGIYAPTEKLTILTPYIVLVGLIGAVSTIFAIRRWRKD